MGAGPQVGRGKLAAGTSSLFLFFACVSTLWALGRGLPAVPSGAHSGLFTPPRLSWAPHVLFAPFWCPWACCWGWLGAQGEGQGLG